MNLALITGANGQLGASLTETLIEQGWLVVAASRRMLDVTQRELVMQLFDVHRPDVVFNAAAFTDVNGAQARWDEAHAVNALGARNVALAACAFDAKLVHISTDYVFDGTNPSAYTEADAPNPINVYGETKLQGERAVQEACPRSFVLRTSWLYGRRGKNFVKTMLKLAEKGERLTVVCDQRGSPTWTRNLALQAVELAQTEHFGLFHATSQGACSWYEFACAIFEEAGLKVEVVPVDSQQYVQPAGRPANSKLDNARLRALGLDVMPHWRDGLRGFMDAFTPTQYATQSEVTI